MFERIADDYFEQTWSVESRRTGMNFGEFDAVFDHFQVTAFRLETLPRYADDEDEESAAFLAGKPLPERSTRTVPWLRRVADITAAGGRWRRVHVVSRPLTDYLRFEMVGYEANVDAGEDVRIADRGMHPELAILRQDFWLFDAETLDAFAMPMHHDTVGHLIGFDISVRDELASLAQAAANQISPWQSRLHAGVDQNSPEDSWPLSRMRGRRGILSLMGFCHRVWG